jgi:RimJ/RimL family protein N-acetyltransferase
MVMGQVCIARVFRSQGIFRGLYGNMQDVLKPEYQKIITEVDTRNTRSSRAHKAIGFTTLTTYSSGGKDWEILQLPTIPTVRPN